MPKTVDLKVAWTGGADCQACSLREFVLFAGMNELDFEHIHQPIDQYRFKPGEKIYTQGSPGNNMVTVRSGLVKLVQYLPDGAQRIVRLVRATDLTGLEALLGKAYEHDAIALEPTEVCFLPVKLIRELIHDNPRIRDELINRWHQALSEADSWLTELASGTAKHRVARLLLKLNNNDPHNCALFSREDIGAILGITMETASRTVAQFKRDGIIREEQPNQFKLNIPGLKTVARS